MKIKSILIVLSLLLSTQIQAQVTINSNKKPEPFSIVQVEGDKAGVRLPRMTSTQMTNIKTTLASDQQSVGLVVYNESDNRIEFWDGTNWISLTGSISGDNAITTPASTSVIELGGNLIKTPTEIDQKTFDMNFTHTAASTGEFNINSSKIKDGDVNIVPGTTFSVNNTAMNVTGGDITMSAEKFTVNTDAFTMESGTTINGTFSYPHTSLQEGYVLASDASGNAEWDGLRPFGTIKKGSLNNNKSFYSTLGEQDITVDQLTLEPGRWIIFAKCTATANSNSSYMYHWLKLVSYTNPNLTGEKFEVLSGINPELVTSGTAYSCPNLVYFVDINVTTIYRIKLGTSNNLSDKTVGDYGGSYFYAVRVDVAN